MKMKIKACIFLIGILLLVKPMAAKPNMSMACRTIADFSYSVDCYASDPSILPNIKGHFITDYNSASDTCSWNFGDGTPNLKGTSKNNVSHVYNGPGTYTVTLTITAPGCPTLTKVKTVNIFTAYADLTSNGTSFTYGQPIILNYNTIFPGDYLRNYAYQLSINGAAYATTTNPYQLSPVPGSYTFVLKSTELSENGCTVYDTLKATVVCPPCLVTGISAVTPVCAGNPTHFYNGVANCPGYGIGATDQVTYLWDYGDGTTATGFAPDHTYTSPGTYIVKMIYLIPAIGESPCNGYSDGGTVTVVVGTCPPPPCEQCIGSFAPTAGNYIIGTWVKQANSQTALTYDKAGVKISCFTASGTIVSGPFYPDANGKIIDGWQRIEQKFTVPLNTTQIKIQLVNTGTDNVYFDDIRIHPVDATMKSYVYDPLTLRLMAELDENNYATFYEYDEEGALIRVKKETERGIVTIKENRNNSSKQ
jgi:hypothetical protein